MSKPAKIAAEVLSSTTLRVGQIIKLDGVRRAVVTRVREDGAIGANYIVRGRLSKSEPYHYGYARADWMVETFGVYSGADLAA